MYFTNLKITDWQQFENIEIDFHDQVTIITGANGSGKTTVLNLLSRHSGWDIPSLATPRKDKSGVIRYFSRFSNDSTTIGSIHYSNNDSAVLQIQNENTARYSIYINRQKQVSCFYIPSHRSIYRYQQLGSIPTAKKNQENAFQDVSNSIRQRYTSGQEQSNSLYMKSILVGWAIHGYGVQKSESESIMPADAEQLRYFEGFQEVLRKVLPKSLGFEKFEIRNMEVIFVCNDGKDDFIFETASGGISALIDMAWQIYMYSAKDDLVTVIIDEIENHLHPTMQRQVLSDLVNAFPKTRFIVSTHSPLVVGSVRDAAIYALTYNKNNKIVSKKLDFVNKAKTATEILDQVLGVSVTMPVWAETCLASVVNKYLKKDMKIEDFKEMRKELEEIGLENFIPSAIKGLIEGKE